MMSKSIKHGIIILLSFLITACGTSGDNADLTHYIYTIKNRKPLPIDPIPDFKALPKFNYPEVDNRRSPFKPQVVAYTDPFAPNAKRAKQHLESFPLDALKFVGILEQGRVIWGLIREPDGLVSRVKPGDYMGQNYGQIAKINDKTIELDELVQLGGKWQKKRIVINLSVPD